MQGLFNFLACSRRNQTSTIETTTKIFQPDINKLTAQVSDTESTVTATPVASERDPGDLSNTEFSDHSEQNSGTPDGSDNEVPMRDFKLVGPPPGLSLMLPPPGLDTPPGLTTAIAQGQTRLKSNAALFVPTVAPPSFPIPAEFQKSSKPKQTISLLKGVLEDWENDITAENISIPQQQPDDAPTLFALQEVLSKLSPQEAAMMRSFLDNKEAKETQQNNACPLDPMLHDWQMGATQIPMNATSVGMNAGGSMVPPPGTFCYGSQPVVPGLVPVGWMHPQMHSGLSHPYASIGSKQQGFAKATRSAVFEEKVQPALADPKDTLRTNLRDLSDLEPSCVLMVRKINRLGLESPSSLEAYFSKFGTVEKVMVSHSRAKSIFGRGAARVRPAGLGFLKMATAEEVKAVLAAGAEHEVEGVIISAHPFESRPLDCEDENSLIVESTTFEVAGDGPQAESQ